MCSMLSQSHEWLSFLNRKHSFCKRVTPCTYYSFLQALFISFAAICINLMSMKLPVEDMWDVLKHLYSYILWFTAKLHQHYASKCFICLNVTVKYSNNYWPLCRNRSPVPCPPPLHSGKFTEQFVSSGSVCQWAWFPSLVINIPAS